MVVFFQNEDSGAIVGGKRNFKSCHLVFLMKHAYDAGFEIFTNMVLSFPSRKLDSSNPDIFLTTLEKLILDRFQNRDFHPVFLGIDEFPQVIESQNWKAGVKTSKIWSQLGKVGITTYVTAQNFNMIYNRYRDNVNKLIITKRIDSHNYFIKEHIQSDLDFTQYLLRRRYVLNGVDIFGLYDTREVMYI